MSFLILAIKKLNMWDEFPRDKKHIFPTVFVDEDVNALIDDLIKNYDELLEVDKDLARIVRECSQSVDNVDALQARTFSESESDTGANNDDLNKIEQKPTLSPREKFEKTTNAQQDSTNASTNQSTGRLNRRASFQEFAAKKRTGIVSGDHSSNTGKSSSSNDSTDADKCNTDQEEQPSWRSGMNPDFLHQLDALHMINVEEDSMKIDGFSFALTEEYGVF